MAAQVFWAVFYSSLRPSQIGLTADFNGAAIPPPIFSMAPHYINPQNTFIHKTAFQVTICFTVFFSALHCLELTLYFFSYFPQVLIITTKITRVLLNSNPSYHRLPQLLRSKVITKVNLAKGLDYYLLPSDYTEGVSSSNLTTYLADFKLLIKLFKMI